jgi:Putative Actinobacterial Holin-X, holin superfamily III
MPEPKEKSVAGLVFDVSERTSALIREEIELAKAEVSEKVTKLLRGSAAGAAAGVFAFLALILIMEGFAWLLNEEVFDNSWAGFFIEAAVFLLIAAGAGYFAYKSVRAGAPPVPEQAIEEAKLIRTTIEGDVKAAVAPEASPTATPPVTPSPTPPAQPPGTSPPESGK